MPLNLIKKYPDLLDINALNERQRIESLRNIFKRDIEDDPNLKFQQKAIRPIKGEEPAMELLFRHLTTEEISDEDAYGKKYPKRVFEKERSIRLHWIKYHLQEQKKNNVFIFSVEERNQKKKSDIIRTYIYDQEQKYVIVLDPQRSKKDYYLITAYYLNKVYGEKKIQKLLKRKLSEVY